MRVFPCLLSSLLVAFSPALHSLANAAPLINEIHYHPQEPEDRREEFIELHNPTNAPIVLDQWRLTRAVDFEFPAGTILAAHAYLVVAADVERFRERYPGVALVIGPWTGRLRNDSESVRLLDAGGEEVDEVIYADEGDWSFRMRGQEDRGHEGWIWSDLHDGEGHSLELVQPRLTNRRGGNWAASLAPGGTPGHQNSTWASDAAPLVFNVTHDPVIPRAHESVTVSATLRDEADRPGALLFYRRGESAYRSVEMFDHGNGRFEGVIPAQRDREIVSFFISASDGAHVRVYPSPGPRETLPGAPFLYQVEDDFEASAPWDPSAQPVYRIILSEAERQELAALGASAAEVDSNAQMNATFIGIDGTGALVRYQCGLRNRGASSRLGPPNNYLLAFRSDDLWRGVGSVKLNTRFVPSQVLGPVLFQRAGVETADALPVTLRINGADAAAASPANTFGSFAQVETFGDAFVSRHFPGDDGGNLYQVRDDENTGEEGDLRYEGEHPDAYRDTYFKQTNETEDDWDDLIALTDRLNNAPDSSFVMSVSEVMDIGQWLRTMAMDALLGNREGGLTSAKGDDYALYRGEKDRRFKLIPHDLDTLLGLGRTSDPARSIWVYGDLAGLRRFFGHPEIAQRYHAVLIDLIENVYRPDKLNPLIDQVLGPWVPDETREAMKAFVVNRREGVLAQIPRTFTAQPDLALKQGHWHTTDGNVQFSGTFDVATTPSIRLNGREALLDFRRGTWSLATSGPDGMLRPGVNHVLVEGRSLAGGAGDVIDSASLVIWYESGPGITVSGMLAPNGLNVGQVRLLARDSYYPGVPILVRVELTNLAGVRRRDIWDAVAILRSDRAEVSVTPDRIRLYNGVGSALVTIGGSSGGFTEALIPENSVWQYLDDGSDAGITWREADFDDSGWKSGAAELGYGDGDEATELLFGSDADNKFATSYFRHRFAIDEAAAIGRVTARLRYDDAAAVYLNGVEVLRTPNLPHDAAYNDYATQDTPDEDAFVAFDIPASALVAGENVMAVEIHQGEGSSSDISFALELTATTLGEDAGDFTLRADVGGTVGTKEIVSLADWPVMTVGGTLPEGALRWEGIVRLTDDVTVPAGKTLEVAAGTLVMIDGTPTPLGTDGVDLIVEGSLRANGSFARPITFTASDPTAPWGEIRFTGEGDSELYYTMVTRAGHSPREGHTNSGPAMNIDGGSVNLHQVAIGDLPGKIMQADNCRLHISDCLFTRAAMGPEIEGSGLLMTDSYIIEMLGAYREDGVIDDDDGIYLHGAGPGQSLTVSGCVIARVDDDGMDTLNAVTTLEDSILRDCFDKGVSANDGHSTIRSSLIVDSGIGVQAKSDGVSLAMAQTTIAGVSTGLLLLDEVEVVTVHNSIVRARENAVEHSSEDVSAIHIDYSNLSADWPGVGNQTADPLFVDAFGYDFRLQSTSPARDAGDPEGPTDPDATRADMGAFPFREGDAGAGALPGTVVWRAADSPIHVANDLLIPEDVTLRVEAGSTVYVAPKVTITVAGLLIAEGSASDRIRFTTNPVEPFVADFHEDLPEGPPHWGGIQFRNTLSKENVLSHVDISYAQSLFGSVGIFQSEVLIEHCTFHGTHLRMIYADRSSVTVRESVFPDMFAPGERTDVLGLDNISEHIKSVGKYPAGGHFIIEGNVFGTNKGHNDVIDVDSGLRPEPVLEVRNNVFMGAGDELLDLGGDALVEGNVFFNVFKDDESSDRGYANAISAGDTVGDAVVMVTRNVFWEVDHAISLKRGAAALFEHNTVYRVHGDFEDRFGKPNVGSVISLLADETPGRGAHVTGNIFVDVPRIFGNADAPEETVSALRFGENLVDPAMPDASVASREDLVFALGNGGNVMGKAEFADAENGDFRLTANSPYRDAGPFGQDFGAFVPAGAWIDGVPVGRTASTSVDLTVGGPGMVAYRYRLDGGTWSEAFAIGNGFDPEQGTVRTALLRLDDLTPGPHTVRVIGQDHAGNWQTEEASTVSKTWHVDPEAGGVILSEILAANLSAYPLEGDYPDAVELHNPTATAISLRGWQLTDDLDNAGRHAFDDSVVLEPGAFFVVTALPFGLSENGDALYLLGPNGERVDEVVFGLQAQDYSLSRYGHRWDIGSVSMGRPNERVALGDSGSVYISEWLGAGSWRVGDGYVELHNPSQAPVTLVGLALSENIFQPSRTHAFPALSFLAPGGYLRCLADEDVSAGAQHLPFRLNVLRGQLILLDANGVEIDYVLTDPQATDISTTRSSGGETVWSDFPTPGAPNEIPPAVLDRWRALLDGLRITEIMYHPQGDPLLEFIEFRNVGSVPLNLDGVRITDGVAFTFPAMRLDPGQETLVVADTAAFLRAYGSEDVAGEFDGRLDNGGETIRLELPRPYSLAISSFRYEDAWAPTTDGGGRSLQYVASSSDPNLWRLASSWRASSIPGGDPAGRNALATDRYETWRTFFQVAGPLEDDDRDGSTNLWEYAFGTDPRIASDQARFTVQGRGADIVVPLIGPMRRHTRLVLQGSENLQSWFTLAERAPGGEWMPALGAVVDEDALRFPAHLYRFIRYAVDFEE